MQQQHTNTCSSCDTARQGGLTACQSSLTYMFVYGTLQKEYNNHHLITKVNGYKYVGKAVLPKYTRTGFTSIHYTGNKDDVVYGEVYSFPVDSDLSRIDQLEGIYKGYSHGYYDKVTERVLVDGVLAVDATCYPRKRELYN